MNRLFTPLSEQVPMTWGNVIKGAVLHAALAYTLRAAWVLAERKLQDDKPYYRFESKTTVGDDVVSDINVYTDSVEAFARMADSHQTLMLRLGEQKSRWAIPDEPGPIKPDPRRTAAPEAARSRPEPVDAPERPLDRQTTPVRTPVEVLVDRNTESMSMLTGAVQSMINTYAAVLLRLGVERGQTTDDIKPITEELGGGEAYLDHAVLTRVVQAAVKGLNNDALGKAVERQAKAVEGLVPLIQEVLMSQARVVGRLDQITGVVSRAEDASPSAPLAPDPLFDRPSSVPADYAGPDVPLNIPPEADMPRGFADPTPPPPPAGVDQRYTGA